RGREGEGAESCVASSASSPDSKSLSISLSTTGQVSCGVDAVLDVNDSPVVIKSQPIVSAISGAAAIVDVHDSDSTTCPILNLVSSNGWTEAGGSSVAQN